MLDAFKSKDAYIETMIEMMKLNNRDPFGKKLIQVKIEDK
jgi:hypothetical protein